MKLCAPSETRSTPQSAQQRRELGRHGLGVGLDRDFLRGRQRAQQAFERRRVEERRRAAAEKDRLELVGEGSAFELELSQHGVDVAIVLALAPDDGDEVAVAAAVRAKGKVHVEVANVSAHRDESPRLSTARNASCGTSTAPTCFIRFFPFFCFSSSLRLRVMSPP